jgi:hypothetical protein
MPQVVDIDHYAGDTLTIHIKVASNVIAGRVFTAQVRSNKSSPKVDATFGVILNAEGADIVLASADCLALTRRGPYEGFWDVQLAMPNGADPVTTLGCGELRLHPDVTRPVS